MSAAPEGLMRFGREKSRPTFSLATLLTLVAVISITLSWWRFFGTRAEPLAAAALGLIFAVAVFRWCYVGTAPISRRLVRASAVSIFSGSMALAVLLVFMVLARIFAVLGSGLTVEEHRLTYSTFRLLLGTREVDPRGAERISIRRRETFGIIELFAAADYHARPADLVEVANQWAVWPRPDKAADVRRFHDASLTLAQIDHAPTWWQPANPASAEGVDLSSDLDELGKARKRIVVVHDLAHDRLLYYSYLQTNLR